MSKELFNDGWAFMYESVEGSDKALPSEKVTLPHDAVIKLERYATRAFSGSSKGYFPNVRLLYEKNFHVDESARGKYLCLQFDGVYRNALVLVNGNYAGRCNNGYERFFIELSPYLNYGGENKVTVEANCGDDARWYTGAGIYRNVYLITADKLHFAHGGVKISTKEADEQVAVLESRLHLVNDGFLPETVETVIELIDSEGNVAATDRRRISVMGNDEAELASRIYVKEPKLWDTDSPNLYTCRASILKGDEVLDEDEFLVGIRQISLDSVRGFRINGKGLKLYGGCIHHDNGIIGSVSFAGAEERRVRLLKEAGYNALRFAHNPMSDELMSACDKYGMVVMAELTDIWNRSKTTQDHAMTFEADWKKSVSSMVDMAYNHPCVMMYSLGNEIREPGNLAGKKLGRELAAEFRRLDPGRYITFGLNAMVIMKPIPAVSDPVEVDVDEINALMTRLADQMGEIQSQEHVVDVVREFSEVLDIVGYNYAEDKQLIDLAKFTNRICVGAETFPRAIAKNWKLVQENPAIIGDFGWAAWDYIGETGIGKNGARGDWQAGLYEGYPYKVAHLGDLDITGNRRPQSYYRECVVGKRKTPYIAVENPIRHGQDIAMTPWGWPDAVSSWSWEGQEGKPVTVEVYGVGDEVELIVNGESLGRKDVPQESGGPIKAYDTVFDTVYQPGRVEAILYQDGAEVGRHELVTASEKTLLKVASQNGEFSDLLYYEISLTDENGILKPNCDRKVNVEVSGAGVLQGFGSASPLSTECFADGEFTTYHGKALLVVRSMGDGEIRIQIRAEGCETVEILAVRP